MAMTKQTKTSKITKAIAGMLIAAALMAAPQAAWASSTTVSTVAANCSQGWTVFVSAGWHHVIRVGDHSTDLDLYVYDRFGNILWTDHDDTNARIVEFYVPFAQYIRINVQNLGDVCNQYVLDVQ